MDRHIFIVIMIFSLPRNLPAQSALLITAEYPAIHLSWDADPFAESYKIYRSELPYFEPSPANFLAETTEPGYLDPQALTSSSIRFYLVTVVSDSVVASLQMILPARITIGHPLPVVIVDSDVNPRIASSETFYFQTGSTMVSPDEIVVKRGGGSVSVLLGSPGYHQLELHDGSGNLLASSLVQVEDQLVYRELSGTLAAGELVWNTGEVIRLTSETTVPAVSLLTIDPGVRIELDEYVRLVVLGEIVSQGTAGEPILFTSHLPGIYWGEIDHPGSTGTYTYTFFTEGGGDTSQAFGHSSSQPVITGWAPDLLLENVYIIDNPGKAVGIGNGILEMNSSLISRCDTGGELHYTLSTITDCYYLDMPDDTGIPSDDDNDALYLLGAWSGGSDTSLVSNCVFITGSDDGIDHNGANVLVENCVIDNYYHEGLATSNANNIEIFNTLVVNCQQGIEAGYGSPTVFVHHCTLADNEIGLRFGDEYPGTASGDLFVTNSIVHNSLQYNVYNWDQSVQGPIPDAAITITYSIVNEPGYNEGEGCLTGTPIFTDEYLLTPGSPGIGAASDNLDMGLLPLNYDGLIRKTIIPTPINNKK